MNNTNGVVANGIEPKTEQEAVNAMVAPPVAIGYKPSPTTDIFWGDDETPYWRMVYDIPHMLLHPYVIIPYLWYKSGIANVEFEIKASSPDVEQFAHAELNNFWSRSLDQAQLVYDYGWLGCEASYHEVNGLMRYHSLHSFKPTDVWALTVKNRFRGVSVQNIQGDVPEQGAIEPAGAIRRGNAQLWGGGRWPGKGIWFVHHKQYDRFYGRSHLYGAWRPWRRLATRDGVEEVCDMAVYRFGVAGPILWYPPDAFKKANGGGIDYDAGREKSREFTEGAKAGASASFPNVRDKEGNKQWELEWPEHTIEVSGLIAYMEKLEKALSCGIGVPPELLEASETGSGYSGRMVPMIGYYASQVKNARNFAHAFLWQSLLPLIRMNYGRDATCEVNVKLKLPTELTGQPPQGAGGPGAAPGAAPGVAGAAPNALPGPSPSAPSPPAGGLLPGPAAPSPAPGGAPPSSGPPEIPYSGPRSGKWLRNVKSGKLRHATMGTELSTLEYEDGEVEYELAAVHAPKGYSRQQPLVIAGRPFVGGEFIPADFLAAATPAQQQALGVTPQATQQATPQQAPIKPNDYAAKASALLGATPELTKEQAKAIMREIPIPASLPQRHDAYFTNPPGTQLIPIPKLRNIRARPDGIANAAKFMEGARLGVLPKRKPISVFPEADGSYTVADGNSTFANARANGWETIPATIVNKETLEAQKAHSPKPEESHASLFNAQEMAPKTAKQPLASNAGYEEAAKLGAEANKQLQALLDLGKGIGAQLGFETIPPGSMTEEQLTRRLEQPGGLVLLAPIKGQKRSAEKVASDYDGDWSKLTDVARASVAVDSMEELKQVIGKLRESGIEFAKPPKDRIANPTDVGYRDVMTNIKMPNGAVVELQLHLKPILIAKQIAHHHYATMRDIDGKMKLEGRVERTPDEAAAHEKAASESRLIYNAAWDKARQAKPAERH